MWWLIGGEEDLKAEVVDSVVEDLELLRCEGFFGEDEGGDLPIASDVNLRTGIGDAGIGGRTAVARPIILPVSLMLSALYQRLTVKIPSGVRLLSEGVPAFESVEAVFAEAECSGTGGCPGVDHTHLNEVEFFGCAGEPAASVVDVKLEIRDAGNVAEVSIEGVW